MERFHHIALKKVATFTIIVLCGFTFSFAQTNVSGTLSGNTTWAKANSPYLLTASVTLSAGDTLTIEPGVEIQFNNYTYILTINGTMISEGLVNDSIVFSGSVAKGNVVLTSSGSSSSIRYTRFEQIAAGNGPALEISSMQTGVVNSSFVNCTVGLSVDNGANVVVDSCIFDHCSYDGIRVLNGMCVITNNVFDDNAIFGLYLTDTAYVVNNVFSNNGASQYRGGIYIDNIIYPYISNNTFSNNYWDIYTQPGLLDDTLYNNNGISEVYVEGGNPGKSITWHKPASPEDWTWVLYGDITINAGDTLLVQPGVKVRFAYYTVDLLINGTLRSLGLVNDSISFTGSPNGGRIGINSSSQNSAFEYVHFTGMGAFNNPAVEVYSSSVSFDLCFFENTEVGITTRNEAAPVIDSCIFKDGNDYAVKVLGGAPVIKNSIIDNISGGGIYLEDTASIFNNVITNNGVNVYNAGIEIAAVVYPYINNNTMGNPFADVITHPAVVDDTLFDNNGLSVVHISGAVIGQTAVWHKPVLPEDWYYMMLNTVTVNAGDSLTIQSGVEVRHRSYSIELIVNGTLLSLGTITDSVKFSGNPNGGRVQIRPSSTNSMIDYTTFLNTGAFGNPSLGIYSSDVTIQRSRFYNCEVGVSVYSNAKPTIDSCFFDQCRNWGIGVYSGEPVIKNCVIDKCKTVGINLQDSAVIFNNVITNNGGIGHTGGIYIHGPIYPSISNNAFSGNPYADIITHPAVVDDTLFDNNGLSVIHLDNVPIGQSTKWHRSQPPESWYYSTTGDVTVNSGDTLEIEPGVNIVFIFYGDELIVNGTLISNGTKSDSISFSPLTTGGSVVLGNSGSASQLSYTHFIGMGRLSVPALSLSSPSTTIKNCTFTENEISLLAKTSTTIDSSLFENSNQHGIKVTSGLVSVSNSCFMGNNFGILADTGTFVNAVNNWWGDASGATHASNPSGLGDEVSDSVAFVPWLLKSACEVDPGPDTLDFLPKDNAFNVPVGTNFRLIFTENIQKGSGRLKILKLADSSVVYDENISNSSIAVAGDSLFFSAGLLPPGIDLFVRIDSNAVQNTLGTAFRGLLTNHEWNFTTEPDLDNDGFTLSMGDCDDGDSTEFPGQVWYADNDSDGFGNLMDTLIQCERPVGYLLDSTDCDDTDSLQFPGQIWYADNDGDGFGNSSDTLIQCLWPLGYVLDSTDCEDTDSLQHPGQTWYADADNDGFGDATTSVVQCLRPPGYVADSTDCNDGDSLLRPGQVWYADDDGDGFGNPNDSLMQCDQPPNYILDSNDCDDTDLLEFPGQTWYSDNDRDLYGNADSFLVQCDRPPGFVLDSNDCNDNDSLSFPGAAEIFDQKDNDCDGEIDEDWIGIDVRDVESGVKIWPNPTDELIYVSVTGVKEESVLIEFFDTKGQLALIQRSDQNVIPINTNILHKGLYVVSVTMKRFRVFRKVVIER